MPNRVFHLIPSHDINHKKTASSLFNPSTERRQILFMKTAYLIYVMAILGSAACSSDDADQTIAPEPLELDGNQESDLGKLTALKEEITALAESVSCSGSDGWNITPMGSKACGGPQFYLAYHNSIDVNAFLRQVEIYKLTEEAFNGKWGIVSTCDLAPTPRSVECSNGSPVLVY